jgi:hypothetical protein
MGAMEQQGADTPADGFGEAERAADKRSSQESGNIDSLLRVVLLCVTSFTRFWSTCWGIVTFRWEG